MALRWDVHLTGVLGCRMGVLDHWQEEYLDKCGLTGSRGEGHISSGEFREGSSGYLLLYSGQSMSDHQQCMVFYSCKA